MTMPPRSAVPVSRRWKFLAVLIACATAAVGLTAHQAAAAAPRTPALTSRSAEGLLQPRTERAKRPQDRYAPAGGCYVVRSASSGGYLVRDGETVTATAGKAAHGTPFHFQATDLGRYLLFTRQADFLGVSDSVLGELTGAAAESSPGAIADGLSRGATQALLREVATGALGTAAGRGSTVGIAANPGELSGTIAGASASRCPRWTRF